MKAFIELLLPIGFLDTIGWDEDDWIIQTSTGDYNIVNMDEDLYDDWVRGNVDNLLIKIEINVAFDDLTFHVECGTGFLSSGSMIFENISISDLEYTFKCPDLEGCFNDRDFEDSNLELCDVVAGVLGWSEVMINKRQIEWAVDKMEKLND
ncbi:MAG: hypothetical protein GY941_21280 [Planctomycetes bacterium]|nr:hypothetical protein [Planctomycetota bacterium]